MSYLVKDQTRCTDTLEHIETFGVDRSVQLVYILLPTDFNFEGFKVALKKAPECKRIGHTGKKRLWMVLWMW